MEFKKLLNSCPFEGTIMWMGIRSHHRSPLMTVETIQVSTESGIVGDHYSKADGNRQVTLIQWEYLDILESILGFRPDVSQLRRNIAVKGINLNALKKSVFHIGDVELEGTGYCHPCSRMEEILGTGGYHAMRGHGGITARVLKPGKFSIHDKLTVNISES